MKATLIGMMFAVSVILVVLGYGAVAAGSNLPSVTECSGRQDMFEKITTNLMVEDVEATVEFYRDVLGFELLVSVPGESGRMQWAMMKQGGAEIMFQSVENLSQEYPSFKGMGVGGSLVLFTVVSDVQAFRKQVEGRAKVIIELHKTFYGHEEFTITDNNGYVITFSQEAEQ